MDFRSSRLTAALLTLALVPIQGPGLAQPPSQVTLEEGLALQPQEAVPVPAFPSPLLAEGGTAASVGQPLSTSQGGGIGLAQVLEIAIRQSPDLQVLKAQVNESQMRALATGLLPNPEIGGGAKKVSGDSSGPLLEISQELPINGELGLARSAAWLSYRADQAESLRETQHFLDQVKREYVKLVVAQALGQLETEHARISEESLRLVTDRFNAGLGAQLPMTLAKAEAATRVQAANLAQGEVLMVRQKLAGLLAMDEPALGPVSGSIGNTLLPDPLDPDSFHRPDLAATQLRVQSAEQSVRAAERARIPNPVLEYSREEAGSDTENFFKVGFEVPILNSGKRAVQEKWAGTHTARSQTRAKSASVEMEREVAWNQLEQRRSAVATYEGEILPAVRQSLEAAKNAFTSGTTDLSVLLQTQTHLLEMERQSIQSYEDLRLAELDYLLALGLPKNGNPLTGESN